MTWRAPAMTLVGTALTASVVAAQTVGSLKFTPPVVVAGQSAPVLMEVQLSGITPSQVTLDPGGGAIATTLVLKDDGSGGDRAAGDGIYSVQLDAAHLLNAMTPDDVHRVFVGFLNPRNGSRYNIFVDVYDQEAGTYPITRLSQFVQATPRIVNIQDPTYFVSGDPTHVTKEFYDWFADDVDVINLVYSPERFLNRNHVTVSNAVVGIGLALQNNTSRYGSDGRLLGISNFPIPGFYDGAETGYIHELGHQWINFLNFFPLGSGIPHWPVSSMAGGVMGFSIGGSGGEGGDFACVVTDQNGVVTLSPRAGAPAYNDFDLYLMGLMPASDVRGQVVMTGVSSPPACFGQTYTGAVQRLSVADIVSHYGPRVPAAGDAPTKLRLATILVTRDELATPEMMWLYSWFTERAELQTRVATHSGFVKELGQPFFVATGGRGTIDTHLAIGGSNDFTLVATPATASVTSGASANYTISAMPRQASFDNSVAFSCTGLPLHAACVFSPADVVPGATGHDVALTITTTDALPAAVPMVAGVALLIGIGWRRPRTPRAQRWVLIAATLMCAAACGSSAPGGPPATTPTPTPTTTPAPTTSTPPGMYSIAVVGTAGAVQHTTSITLIVQ